MRNLTGKLSQWTGRWTGIPLAAALLGGMWLAQAQQPRAPFPPTPSSRSAPAPDDPRVKLEKRIVKESFEQMRKESQQLVEMSFDLRDLLRNATEDELSIGIMKKAEAIEKLAEKIKNRMKNL